MVKKFSLALGGLGLAAALIAVQLRTAPTNPSRRPAPLVPVASEAEREAEHWREFVTKSAQTLDQPHVDSARVTKTLQRTAESLTPAQTQALLRVVRDPKTPPGQKVLSTYLLVHAEALGELKSLIEAPMNQPNVAEKTLKLIALDGLAHVADKGSGDPSLKAYAREYLRRFR